ncbi:acyltransferase [Phenylobacterium sp.]|uniref:acyltransferase family protein n=1 Tax=Phenylobacterium sp. TaxID=1871053 RepID=UPI002E373DAA|nr:acyltransferase [Phenylobacterium sp.]HEX4711820.1 acyltransferase [Phenylobacterium sp.]
MNPPLNPLPPQRPANGIGALRLLFASLVIVSHSPEMLDGNLEREPLHMLFHTLSSGRLAVDAFFLISGYLIAASFAASAGVGSYFMKRILRIYPAFVVCFLLCVFLVAPLAGASLRSLGAADWGRLGYRLVLLKSPAVDQAFATLPYPALNGSAWTISYEFRCYILAALLGMVGLYGRRGLYLALTAVVVTTSLVLSWPDLADFRSPAWLVASLGEPHQQLKLLAAFMVGTCFWLYSKDIVLRGRYAAVAAVPLLGLMFMPQVAETALILLGGYILFWVAFKVSWKPLLTINAKDDISYGVYLYAWPIGALLIWYWRDIPVGVLAGLTFLGAVACGHVSWLLIEKPAMSWKWRSRRIQPRIDSPTILTQGNLGPDADVRQGEA